MKPNEYYNCNRAEVDINKPHLQVEMLHVCLIWCVFYDRLMAQKKERLLKMETQQVWFMGSAMIEH